jgi:hypothetical protein
MGMRRISQSRWPVEPHAFKRHDEKQALNRGVLFFCCLGVSVLAPAQCLAILWIYPLQAIYAAQVAVYAAI